MSSIKLSPNASGTGIFTIAAPNSNTDRTLTLPDSTGTAVLDTATQTLTNKTLGSGLVMSASVITAGTAVASTSGTSIDFTGIPSWVKRITVMFNGVSTNGTSAIIVRLGTSSGVDTTGYASGMAYMGASQAGTTSTAGLLALYGLSASDLAHGLCTIALVNASTNLWAANSTAGFSTSNYACAGGGSKSLASTLDRIRITTVNGTDTFDAGSINILYE